MSRKDSRYTAEGGVINITHINGNQTDTEYVQWIDIENIGKGGFCFSTDQSFEIEDRLQIVLRLSDSSENNVLGRVCYSNPMADEKANNTKRLYGFSVITGFYKLVA